MEHTIRIAAGGVVEAIYFAPGETVAADTLLVQLKEVFEIHRCNDASASSFAQQRCKEVD